MLNSGENEAMEMLEKREDGNYRKTFRVWTKTELEKEGSATRNRLLFLQAKSLSKTLNILEINEIVELILFVMLNSYFIKREP